MWAHKSRAKTHKIVQNDKKIMKLDGVKQELGTVKKMCGTKNVPILMVNFFRGIFMVEWHVYFGTNHHKAVPNRKPICQKKDAAECFGLAIAVA